MPNCSRRWGFDPNSICFFVLTQKRNQKKSRLRPQRPKNQRPTAKIFLNSPAAQTEEIF
jgi:hypothetical protein